jgi:hypothetical protein
MSLIDRFIRGQVEVTAGRSVSAAEAMAKFDLFNRLCTQHRIEFVRDLGGGKMLLAGNTTNLKRFKKQFDLLQREGLV